MARERFRFVVPGKETRREKWALAITVAVLAVSAFGAKPMPVKGGYTGVIFLGLPVPAVVLWVSLIVALFVIYSICYHLLEPLEPAPTPAPHPLKTEVVRLNEETPYPPSERRIPEDATAEQFLAHVYVMPEDEYFEEPSPMWLKWQDDAYEERAIRQAWLETAPESVLRDLLRAAPIVLGLDVQYLRVAHALEDAHYLRGIPSWSELMDFAVRSGDHQMVSRLESKKPK